MWSSVSTEGNPGTHRAFGASWRCMPVFHHHSELPGAGPFVLAHSGTTRMGQLTVDSVDSDRQSQPIADRRNGKGRSFPRVAQKSLPVGEVTYPVVTCTQSPATLGPPVTAVGAAADPVILVVGLVP
jgi:hypothetical protein